MLGCSGQRILTKTLLYLHRSKQVVSLTISQGKGYSYMLSIKFPGPAIFFPKVSCLKNYRKKHGKFPRIPNIYDVKHWAVVSWAFFMNLVPLMLIPVVGSNIHIWSKRVKLTVGSRDLSQVEKKKYCFQAFVKKKCFHSE